jgi:hypothetical protein
VVEAHDLKHPPRSRRDGCRFAALQHHCTVDHAPFVGLTAVMVAFALLIALRQMGMRLVIGALGSLLERVQFVPHDGAAIRGESGSTARLDVGDCVNDRRFYAQELCPGSVVVLGQPRLSGYW